MHEKHVALETDALLSVQSRKHPKEMLNEFSFGCLFVVE